MWFVRKLIPDHLDATPGDVATTNPNVLIFPTTVSSVGGIMCPSSYALSEYVHRRREFAEMRPVEGETAERWMFRLEALRSLWLLAKDDLQIAVMELGEIETRTHIARLGADGVVRVDRLRREVSRAS